MDLPCKQTKVEISGAVSGHITLRVEVCASRARTKGRASQVYFPEAYFWPLDAGLNFTDISGLRLQYYSLTYSGATPIRMYGYCAVGLLTSSVGQQQGSWFVGM